MKPTLALALALLPVIVAASPVHVTLKPSAIVQPDGAGFFPLGSVAALSGGSTALRGRLAAVCVGRAPLPGDVRHLTPGDLALKLRQAGFQPGVDAVLDGAAQADVTVSAPPAPDAGGDSTGLARHAPSSDDAGALLIHPGDPVTIRVDDGGISVTAVGVAETGGAAGAAIRVRRDGVSAALDATVLDAQTVELEF